jgi:hypothetical protein
MMTAHQCRAKASEMFAVADQKTRPAEQEHWRATATDWLSLARTAEAQAGLEAKVGELGER